MLDISIRRSFSLVPSTYAKFILILLFYSGTYVACVCFWDWDKLWLLVILLNILLIFLSWYPFTFSTFFLLAFSLIKSSFMTIIEYALLNKEDKTLSIQLFWWWELECSYCSVSVGFLYTSTEIFSFIHLNKVSRNASSLLFSSYMVNVTFDENCFIWWKNYPRSVRLRMKQTSSANHSQTLGRFSTAKIAVSSWICLWISVVVEYTGPPKATPSVCW